MKIPEIKKFVHDYNFPLIVTVIFLIVVAIAGLLHASQKSSLAEVLTEVANGGQDYGTLLSKDKVDELKKNNETSQPTAGTPTGVPSSFAINTNTTNSSSGSNISTGSGVIAPSSPVFSASIGSFQQNSVTLECTSQKPKRQTCSKRYVYGATIRTKNGPGVVKFGWRSNLQSVVEDGNASAASGDSQTTLQKVITLDCSNATSVSLQFVILSPSPTQSAVLNINHNCNEI